MKKITEIHHLFLIAPIDTSTEAKQLEQFIHDIQLINAKLKIVDLYWNKDKKLPKSKNYQRKYHEWNNADFSFWGKLNNAEIANYLERKHEVFIVFGDKYPEKVNKCLKKVSSELKIGFQKNCNYFDVLFSTEPNTIEEQIKMIKKYLI